MNKFTEIMRKRSDEELNAIVKENRHDYTQEAIDAAIEVLSERGNHPEIISEAQTGLEIEVDKSIVHYVDESQTKVDLIFHKDVKKIYSSCKWAGYLMALLMLMALLASVEGVIGYVLFGITFLTLSYRACKLIQDRRPDAIFISKATLIIFMVVWGLITLSSFSIGDPIRIIRSGVMAYLLFYIYTGFRKVNSEDSFVVFPKDFRIHTTKDLLFVIGVVIVPIFIGGVLSFL